jgi:hypothetical protein
MSQWTEKDLQNRPGVRNVSDSRESGTRMRFPQGGKGGPKPQPKEPKQRKNQTEQRYERDHLWPQYQSGEIWDYRFEPIKLRLADNTFYTPDFLVVRGDGLEIHEIKGGFEREDARVKWKAAAEAFPWFRFVVARYDKKKWKIEEYG